MAPWVKDADDATAAGLLNYYQPLLTNPYIAYSGTGDFTANGDYARIDGPNAWISSAAKTRFTPTASGATAHTSATSTAPTPPC